LKYSIAFFQADQRKLKLVGDYFMKKKSIFPVYNRVVQNITEKSKRKNLELPHYYFWECKLLHGD
jgi:uncharacterized UPF0160 family protein